MSCLRKESLTSITLGPDQRQKYSSASDRFAAKQPPWPSHWSMLWSSSTCGKGGRRGSKSKRSFAINSVVDSVAEILNRFPNSMDTPDEISIHSVASASHQVLPMRWWGLDRADQMPGGLAKSDDIQLINMVKCPFEPSINELLAIQAALSMLQVVPEMMSKEVPFDHLARKVYSSCEVPWKL